MTMPKWTLKMVPADQSTYGDGDEWEIHEDGHEYNPIMGNKPFYPFVPDEIGKAHLIAAAPDLYEALEEIIRQYDDLEIQGGEPTEMTLAYGRAYFALAKARGEQ